MEQLTIQSLGFPIGFQEDIKIIKIIKIITSIITIIIIIVAITIIIIIIGRSRGSALYGPTPSMPYILGVSGKWNRLMQL